MPYYSLHGVDRKRTVDRVHGKGRAGGRASGLLRMAQSRAVIRKDIRVGMEGDGAGTSSDEAERRAS